MFDVRISPSGLVWYVLETKKIGGETVEAHRDTSIARAGAVRFARELRAGRRRYDPDKGHTVPINPDGDPLAAMLAELEQ